MLIRADARHIPLVDGCVQCVVTSPPYWGLRDYGVPGQLGLNQTPAEYVRELLIVFAEVRRVLRADGVVWLNLGDSYQNAKGQAGGVDLKQKARRRGLRPQDRSIPGLKPKDLVGIPWMVALALRDSGWWLRRDQIWDKPDAHPEPVADRTSTSHEYVFLLTKSRRYYFNAAAIGDEPSPAMLRQVAEGYRGEATRDYSAAGAPDPSATKLRVIRSARRRIERDGRLWVNSRSVWRINTESGEGDHCAVMPQALATKCILAGSRPGDLVYDPFIGSGTVGAVAERFGRRWVGTDLSYQDLAKKRTAQRGLKFA